MAEVPNAHAKRLQTLVGWLVQCQGGAALPFLLPGLLLCGQPDADSLELVEPGTHRSWQQALLQPEASDALLRHLFYVCLLHFASKVLLLQQKNLKCWHRTNSANSCCHT